MSHSRASQISGRSIISILPRHRTCGTFVSKVMGIAVLWLSIAWCGHAATYYVDASRVDDSGAGTSWATAKKTIQAAVNASVSGDTVLVTNGVYNTGAAVTPGYALNNRVVITNAITVRSINGPSVTTIEGSGTNWFNTSSAVRCVYMKSGVLAGFTLAKGATFGSFSFYDVSGGGVSMSDAIAGTLVTNCIISGCMARRGGGSYGGTLYNCALSGNTASYGGGSYNGTLNNCALSGNTASYGGGSDGGTMYNCTLSGNTASDGGGSYYGTLYNCIVWGNKKSDGTITNYQDTVFYCSCTTPLPSGPGNISLDPLFCDTSDYRLQLGSPCLNTGSNGYVFVMTDLNGAPRIQDGTVDMGAYEGVERCSAPAFSPVTGRTYTNTVNVTLSCTTAGVSMRYTTDGSDPTLDSTVYAGGFILTNTATVKAKAFKSGMLESETATAIYTVFQTVATPTFSPNTGTSFSNSLDVTITCATQDAAIRYTLDGSAPTADSQQYTHAVTITKSTTVLAKAFKAGFVESATASASYHCTVLYVDAARPDDSGDGSSWQTAKKTIQAAVQLARAGDTVVVTNGVYNTGITVTPGYALNNRVVITNAIIVRSINGPSVTIIEGSGTNWFGTSSAVRCVYMKSGVLAGFTLAKGATFGSGLGSSDDGVGGGVSMNAAIAGPLVTNCTISGCMAYRGGGSCYGTLNNCTLSGNTADYSGGGSCYGTLYNCALSGNTASRQGGGGSFYGTLYNCALSGNTASDGGGSYYGTLYNCTLSGNTASDGGSYYGTLYNCIVWGNKKSDGTTTNYQGAVFYYSCTTPLPAGGGNIDADPQLVDTQNLRLREGSPCIDSGDNGYMSLTTDLAGNPRIQNGTVDMGAFEGSVSATAAPVFSPSSGARFTDSLAVTVTCATAEAVIRYTLDGSEPMETNGICSAPLTLTGSVTVRAKAFKEGLVAAQSAADYTRCVAVPVFSPASGSVGTNTLAVAITCGTEGAIIRYTLNNSEPSESSAEYTNVLTLTQSRTVKAKAFKPGLAESATATAGYTVIYSVATPTFSPQPGGIATNSASVTIGCSTGGATIRYTLDGTDPEITSSVYSGPIYLTQTTVIKARGYRSGWVNSDVAVAEYTIIPMIAVPVLLPASGTCFSGLRKITMSCPTEGVEIRYTVDGTEPARGSLLYTKAFNIGQTTTVKVKAFKDGMADSRTVTATYYNLPPLSEAVDVTNLLVTTGGGANWLSQTNVTRDGVDAALSGAITDGRSTWMGTTVTGPGTLSFWWKTSCEDDPDADNWDYLRFSVDGIEQRRLDGITEWLFVTLTLGDGVHVVRWEYVKDESIREGNDCAWVDQLSFNQGLPTVTATTPVPVPYAWLDQYPFLLGLAGGDHEAMAWADMDGDGHTAWQEYVTGSVPTNRESVLRTRIDVSNGVPWLTWTPDLGSARVYTVEGRANADETAWGPTNFASRFFRVKVWIP